MLKGLTFSIIGLVVTSSIYGAPSYLPDDKLEQRDDLIEGDILPNPESKNGIRGDKYRWPNRTISYEMDPQFNSTEVTAILLAWNEIENKTCITLKQRRPEDRNYVFIQKGKESSGCYTAIGKIGGRQILSFESRCVGHHGTMVHEMLHTVGFYHEISRPDRDDYVTIIWDKIEPGKEHNFTKYTEEEIDTMGTPYDYGSILHAPAFQFSIDGNATVIPKDPTAEIGQRIGLSVIDAYKVNVMYNCSTHL